MASNDIFDESNAKTGSFHVNLGKTEPLNFEGSSHSQDILKGLYQQFKNESFCDVILVFGKKEIKAHKVVLASSSQYFEVMFSANFADATQQRLEINGVGENVGKALIEFAYTGKIEINSENVIDLLAAANFLQGFQNVEKTCAEFLMKYSGKHNLFQILAVADHYNQIDNLKKPLKTFCTKNFVDCVENDNEAFLSLNERLFLELIACEELIVCVHGIVLQGKHQEEYLLKKVLEYLEHNQGIDIEVAEILKSIRLPLLKKPFLHALKSNTLLQSKESFEVLSEAIAIKKGKKAKQKPKPDWTKWRNCGEYQLWKGRCLAAGGQISNEQETFKDIQEDSYVSGIKLWIRRFDGRPVIGGIQVQFGNGEKVFHGTEKPSESEEFSLEVNERIVKLDSQSGWMIDNLAFYTSKDRKLGPFGGPGGGFRHEVPPGLHGYLVGIEGSVVKTQDDLGITKLRFVWRLFRLPNQTSIPDFQPITDLFGDSFDDDDDFYDDPDFYDNDYDDFYDIEDENDFDTDYDDGDYGADGYDDFYDSWHYSGEVREDDWEAIVGVHEPLANNLDKEVD